MPLVGATKNQKYNLKENKFLCYTCKDSQLWQTRHNGIMRPYSTLHNSLNNVCRIVKPMAIPFFLGLNHSYKLKKNYFCAPLKLIIYNKRYLEETNKARLWRSI